LYYTEYNISLLKIRPYHYQPKQDQHYEIRPYQPKQDQHYEIHPVSRNSCHHHQQATACFDRGLRMNYESKTQNLAQKWEKTWKNIVLKK
jgi:hypothetical protein